MKHRDDDLRKHDKDREKGRGKDSNPDPITGAPGSHPVGTGLGAAGAGAAGAAIGGVAGPVGAVVGAAIGAVAGGLAGKGVAEAIDPTVEDAYWRETYRNRPYTRDEAPYDEYEPAYRYGWETAARSPGRRFDEAEPELRDRWEEYRGPGCRIDWNEARPATQDAWQRVHERQSTTATTHDTTTAGRTDDRDTHRRDT